MTATKSTPRPRSRPAIAPAATNQPGRYDVRLGDFDMEHSVDITLPFPPFPGLMLRAPFFRMDYLAVDMVYWDDENNRFEVYFEYCSDHDALLDAARGEG